MISLLGSIHLRPLNFTAARRLGLLAGTLAGFSLTASAAEPCKILVVEKGSGWPVPLIELRTTAKQRFITDNAGVIAFNEPDLLGHETWFDVSGHGYEVPKDGFGYRGVRLIPKPGATLKVEVSRVNIAKRLGRVTGAGLFAESQKLGEHLDWKESGIVGSDSVQNAVYQGKMFWAWGDTMVPSYPLGIYSTSSATSAVKPLSSFEPPLQLPLDYFRNEKGAVRGVANMPGSGPTWVTGYVTLPDKTGKRKLVCTYEKITGHLDTYETGLAVWNDATQNFDSLLAVWKKSDNKPKPATYPKGHPAFWNDAQNREWVYFGDPLPKMRCPATFEAWQDSTTWEPLQPQSSFASANGGEPVKPHTGSIAWNPWRKRWVTVFMQAFGKPSALGELWYAEADAPTGPWGAAVKVLTHDNYTFYNPRLHPEFTPAESPILLFEGTYTQEFANHAVPTPRYDYNQILYRLDLDDPALKPAQVAGAESVKR